MSSKGILVVSLFHPEAIELDGGSEPVLDDTATRNDSLDDFNHPRYRRAIILRELSKRGDDIVFETPFRPAKDLTAYQNVHSERLIKFLSTSWERWDALGSAGQDPANALSLMGNKQEDCSTPPLIPQNYAIPRDPYQRPSQNVMGQIGFFCTDTCTPVFAQLKEELLWDCAVMQRAIASIERYMVVYALATHPGHHSANDSFGGYCYLNHAAFAARSLQNSGYCKVCVLDIDYHCGNGTASIFYDDPSVLVISIHCHPDYEYPFHTGFEDEIGAGDGEGVTLHLPLLPGATWREYLLALTKAIQRIQSFGAEALIISLGLDTLAEDPCAIRRAGFKLFGTDYLEMGRTIGRGCKIPSVVIQEGGYLMEKVPQAAADVLIGLMEEL